MYSVGCFQVAICGGIEGLTPAIGREHAGHGAQHKAAWTMQDLHIPESDDPQTPNFQHNQTLSFADASTTGHTRSQPLQPTAAHPALRGSVCPVWMKCSEKRVHGNMYTYIHLHTPICPSIYLSNLSIESIYLSTYLPIYASTHLCVYACAHVCMHVVACMQ